MHYMFVPTVQMRAIKCILISIAIINLLVFLVGLFLGVFVESLIIISLVFIAIGLFGMVAFAIIWAFHPQALYKKHFKRDKFAYKEDGADTKINPGNTEELMRNIRGIPFLIQAIQYSMETTYYRDMMSEMGEGVVRTSVIHTAPACRSVLDTDDEEEKVQALIPSHCADTQWQPSGESWRNEQLRLSIKNEGSNLLVFPLCESSVQGDSDDGDTIENELPRVNSIGRLRGIGTRTPNGRFQLRCIGMSASFIQQFNSSLSNASFDQTGHK